MIGLLVERRAAEFGRPNDQGPREHPAPLQIGQQSRDRPIDRFGQPSVVGHIAVRIPIVARAGVDQLQEPHTFLGQSPGHEALPAEPRGGLAIDAVELEGLVRFFTQVERFRRFALHAEGRLEGTDAGFEGPVGRAGFEVGPVQLLQQREFHRLQIVAGDARLQVRQRLRARHDVGPLMATREEVAPPRLRPAVGGCRGEHHERRQVPIHRPQPVADPRSGARSDGLRRTVVRRQRGLVVAIALAVHGVQHAHIVDHRADVRKEITDAQAALTVGFVAPLRADEVAVELAGFVQPATGGDGFAVIGDQLGLLVEGVDLGNPPGGVDEDDAIGLRGEVARAGGERVARCDLGRAGFGHHSGECERAESAGSPLQPFAPIEVKIHVDLRSIHV